MTLEKLYCEIKNNPKSTLARNYNRLFRRYNRIKALEKLAKNMNINIEGEEND